MKKKHWSDYLWVWTILYFTLGFFNILFAWLGMIDFLVPLFIAILAAVDFAAEQLGCRWKNRSPNAAEASRTTSASAPGAPFPEVRNEKSRLCLCP